jgi:ubiquinone/menaquinone biosynthesis C-methylase UbiE
MRRKNLSEGSRSYHDEAEIYESFSKAEDAPEKIGRFLKSVVKGKDVLDLGCGTGKYAASLSRYSRGYFGLDISREQLRIAKKKVGGCRNLRWICSSAENIPLSSSSVDVVISTWVIGTIKGTIRKKKAISEALRVLRSGGKIFLVENDLGVEFEMIRGRFPNISRTKRYNDWLEEKMGFKVMKRFSTHFDFSSKDEARRIVCSI